MRSSVLQGVETAQHGQIPAAQRVRQPRQRQALWDHVDAEVGREVAEQLGGTGAAALLAQGASESASVCDRWLFLQASQPIAARTRGMRPASSVLAIRPKRLAW
jgi:hypothetical protein